MSDDTYFDTRLSYEPERDAVWAEIVRYLQRYIPEKATILELGAGYCSFINQVKAAEKHALDRSPLVKKFAAPEVITHVMDCENLQRFRHAQFDTVFSSFLYEHLTREKLNRVMEQLRRILKPDGTLITLLPNFKYAARHYFDDYTHIQIFSHVSFPDYLVSRGFQIKSVEGRFLPFTFKSWLPPSAWLTRLYLALPYRPLAGNMLVVAGNTDRNVSPAPIRDSGKAPSSTEKRSESKTSGKTETQFDQTDRVQYGRRSRRTPADHYGVKETHGSTANNRETDPAPVNPGAIRPLDPSVPGLPEDDQNHLSPMDLRNRRRNK